LVVWSWAAIVLTLLLAILSADAYCHRDVTLVIVTLKAGPLPVHCWFDRNFPLLRHELGFSLTEWRVQQAQRDRNAANKP
jgi:hypothetical protein